MNNYPHLNDKEFLRLFDKESHKKQYLRINVLNFSTEEEIATIEGKATGGNCSLNGSSNMRRTANCSLVVDPNGIWQNGVQYKYANITEVRNLISMNKKVRIETGYDNTLYNNYSQYGDIVWFPLGTYVIKAASVSRNATSINISLTLNDKTALLNGDMGGMIPAATVFSEMEVYNAEGTRREVKKELIYDIIRNLLINFGGEKPENIIITDIPTIITKVVKWNGKTPLYYYKEGAASYQFSLVNPIEDVNASDIVEYVSGQNIGYMSTPFVYPGDLECKEGETVAAMLDKIKNTLGNFEWFYDVYGRFVFQQKRNFLNESLSTTILELTEQDYLTQPNLTKETYTFDENNVNMQVSLSLSPQFANIKNDYIVWGAKKTSSETSKPIRYHVSFKSRPKYQGEQYFRKAIVYTDYRGIDGVIILKDNINCVSGAPSERLNSLPSGMDPHKIYFLEEKETKILVHCWDEDKQQYLSRPRWEVCYLRPSGVEDWRTELYFQCLEDSDQTVVNNYYAAELRSEWNKIYNVRKTDVSTANKMKYYQGGYYDDSRAAQDDYEYWIDFIEGSQGGNYSLSQFNVENIGRRSKVVTDTNVTCLFPMEINNLLIASADGDTSQEQREAEQLGMPLIQVGEDIFKDITVGNIQNSAFEKVKELLYAHTSYNESITIAAMPVYYLEPNSLIKVQYDDGELLVNGYYSVNTISIPLTTNGTMSISAVKHLEKTF